MRLLRFGVVDEVDEVGLAWLVLVVRRRTRGRRLSCAMIAGHLPWFRGRAGLDYDAVRYVGPRLVQWWIRVRMVYPFFVTWGSHVAARYPEAVDPKEEALRARRGIRVFRRRVGPAWVEVDPAAH